MSERRRRDHGLSRAHRSAGGTGLAVVAVLAGLANVMSCTAPGPEPAADAAVESVPETAARATPEAWNVSIAPLPEDVSSLDGILRAWYDIVSGPAGEPRNWARDSTLYVPGVRFVTVDAVQGGGYRANVTDHGTFATRSAAAFEREGFWEREIHRVTQRVGNVAYILSTYEWRRTPDGPAGGRGVNSISLFWDGNRWWITQAMWSDETPDQPIPPELLPGG